MAMAKQGSAMSRWYRAFQCHGDVREIIENITNVVRRYDLGKYISCVRFERGARFGEFYLYLGIRNSSAGLIPPEVENTLLQLHYFSVPIPGVLHDRDIKVSVGSVVTIDDSGHPIRYVPPVSNMQEDLFSSEPNDDESQGNESERTGQFDRLLYWLSAVGSGSWETFRSTCRELALDIDGAGSRRILRQLTLLGHIETSPDRSHWSVTPLVIAQQDASTRGEVWFLSGQRSADLLSKLKKFGEEPIAANQFRGNGPSLVTFDGADQEQLLRSLSAIVSPLPVYQAGRVAQRLADILPTIDDWMASLTVVPGIRPYMYLVKRFDGERFIDEEFEGNTGLYELWPLKPERSASSRPTYTLFYDASTKRWLRGDWYGLRYLALQQHGVQPTVHYISKEHKLLVDSHARWPELYERALVLASGRLPRQSQKGRWLIYETVGPHLLQTLESQLQITVEEVATDA